jgi:hypothetical protein
MSTYIDIRSGKWFETRAELRAFQKKGEVEASPFFVPNKKRERPASDFDVRTEKPEQNETEPEDLEQENGYHMNIDDDGTIRVKLSRDEMVAALKEAGVDGRSLAKKDDEGIAHMYAMRFNK